MLFPIAHFAAVDTWGKASRGQLLVSRLLPGKFVPVLKVFP
jgi:hypothetical protein